MSIPLSLRLAFSEIPLIDLAQALAHDNDEQIFRKLQNGS
jgi:hypothetical protein